VLLKGLEDEAEAEKEEGSLMGDSLEERSPEEEEEGEAEEEEEEGSLMEDSSEDSSHEYSMEERFPEKEGA
jgi:hypothetical protein